MRRILILLLAACLLLNLHVLAEEPVDPAPVDPAPVDPTPVDPTPVDPTPEDPTPEDPTPEDPTPEDPTPEDPAPADPDTPEEPTDPPQTWYGPTGPEYTEVELRVYRFLVKEMGLSRAAACGIMSNIAAESRFDSRKVGDQGLSFGLCQWQYERRDALNEFCEANELDIYSVEAQLLFLRWELEGGYWMVRSYLDQLVDTASGAWYAGYYWCVEFQRPTDAEAKARGRAEGACEGFWKYYSELDL